MISVVILWLLYALLACWVWLTEPSASSRRDKLARIWLDYNRQIA